MDTTIERAPAKLNLALDVLKKRPDGYHDMRMVMQSVGFCDELSLTLNREGRCAAHSNLRYIPGDERNLAVKAAKAFFSLLGEKNAGVDISIKKRIPVCAGMGGGSADAAAVLRALNRMTGRPLSASELERLADTLGSDVPFCVVGGTALAEGRGELLTPAAPLPDCSIVICKPRFSVSTPKLFAALDECPCKLHPDINGMTAALADGNLRGVAQRMYNVFEHQLTTREEIGAIKRTLLDSGALGSVMTGTGSAVFGIFEKKAEAQSAADELSRRYSETAVTSPTQAAEI